MSAAFDRAFDTLMEYEGGYVNDPNDHGGETNFGISKNSYPDEDIKNMTLTRAKELYKRDYWNPLRLDEVESIDIAEEIFEQAVNMGRGTAARHTQEALNYLGRAVRIDGSIGPKTLEAINNFADKRLLFKVLNGIQFCRYFTIVKADPSQSEFARGWLRRIVV